MLKFFFHLFTELKLNISGSKVDMMKLEISTLMYIFKLK